jgi:plastocyanin
MAGPPGGPPLDAMARAIFPVGAMRRRDPAITHRPIALAVALAVAFAGCSSGDTAGTGNTGGDGATAVGPFSGATVTVQAIDVQFEPDTITMPSGQPLRIVLDNQDAGVPHDVHVFQGDTDYGKSTIVTGPGLTELRFGPLPPARYTFACTIHPDMAGTLIVTP